MWRQEMHDIEQRRIDLSPEQQQMQKVNCGGYKTTLHGQKNVDRWAKKNEQLRNETEKAPAEMEDTGRKHQAESQVETELDLEIRGLQAGEARRGSNASQSNGCCMDPAFSQHFPTSGADFDRQQLLLLWSAFGKTCGMPHQLTTVTPVHAPKRNAATEEEAQENDEGQRKSASRGCGPPVPGGSQ